MYAEILVPTDGSDASMAAVEQGVELAAEFDATVHFSHVVDVGTEMSASGIENIANELTTTLERWLPIRSMQRQHVPTMEGFLTNGRY